MEYRPGFAGFVLTAQLFLAAAASAAAAAPEIEGWWLDPTGRAAIQIASCEDDGARLCGHIAWLREPSTPEGGAKTDYRNPDKALRAHPLCGLQILGRFTSDGAKSWGGGWIYDPEDGATYKSHLLLEADGTLHLRGYIGVPLFGRTQIWTRPPTVLPHCAVAP